MKTSAKEADFAKFLQLALAHSYKNSVRNRGSGSWSGSAPKSVCC